MEAARPKPPRSFSPSPAHSLPACSSDGRKREYGNNPYKSKGHVGSSDGANSLHIGVSDAHIYPESTQASVCPSCGKHVCRFTSRTKHGTNSLYVCPGCKRQWSTKGKGLTPGRRKRLAKLHKREKKQKSHAERQLAATARRIEEYGRPDDGTALERFSQCPIVRHRHRLKRGLPSRSDPAGRTDSRDQH